MDREYQETTRKQIIDTVYKPKCSIAKIKANAVTAVMELFIANKQLFMGVSLNEIKNMTPQEAYILGVNIKKYSALYKG